MSILKNYKINWDDIDNIYDKINTQKQRFSITPLTFVPDNKKSKIKTEHLENLINSIEALQTNKYIGNTAITGIEVPNKKTKIKAFEFQEIDSVIDEIALICPDDTSNYTSYCPSNYTSYCPSECYSDDNSECGSDDSSECGSDDSSECGSECNTECNSDDSSECNNNYDHCGSDFGQHDDCTQEDICGQADYTTDNNYNYSTDCGLDCANIVEQ